ncbi:MAG TPA: TraR/DksA C4-type zinc finger protein [Candidatus Sulfobium mesophilum]|nr:TraR/DksA C4-type zinc finger protein [Candidatus Sulfobium mesophilum]
MAVKKGAKKKKATKPKAKRVTKKATKKSVRKPRITAKKKVTKKAVKKGAKKKKVAKKKIASMPSSKSKVAQQPVRISAATQKRHELLKKLLLKKRNEVVEGLEARMGRRLVPEAGQKIDSAMDSADLSSQDMDQGIDYSLLEMKYEQYKDIADAFRKLQNNTYGLCEECGEEIDIKRLQVNPLARYCITCKTRKEEIERIQKEETRFKE